MPQFDPAVWMPQFVWLAISFVALYLILSRVVLPRISDVLEEREHKINEGLRKADVLKEEAEIIAASYEKSMAEARAKAQDAVRQVREKAAADAAERHAELSERLQAEVGAAEKRIDDAKAAALADLRDTAAEIAGVAVDRLIGKGIDAKTVGAAVDAMMRDVRS